MTACAQRRVVSLLSPGLTQNYSQQNIFCSTSFSLVALFGLVRQMAAPEAKLLSRTAGLFYRLLIEFSCTHLTVGSKEIDGDARAQSDG